MALVLPLKGIFLFEYESDPSQFFFPFTSEINGVLSKLELEPGFSFSYSIGKSLKIECD